MKTFVLCLLAVALTVPLSAGAVDLTPVAYVRKVGSFDASKPGTPSIGYLVRRNGQGLPSQRTRVSLAYDDANLYVVFDCGESQMSKLVAAYTGHDEQLWRDDCVEVFLDTKHDHKTYYQVIANVVGAKYDAMNNAGPDSWNGEWNASITKKQDGWVAVVTIPFGSMGVPTPKPGTVWGADFMRREQRETEVGFWCVVESNAHEPERYGHLVFGDENSPAICMDPVEIDTPGVYRARLAVGNPSERAVELNVDPHVDGRALVSKRKASPPGESAWSFPFVFSDEGERRFGIAVRDASGRVVMRTPAMLVDIPTHRARLSSYAKQARELRPWSAESKRRNAEVTRALRAVSALAAEQEQSGGRWSKLGAALDALLPQLGRLRYMCADNTASGYVLGRETSILKLRRDLPFEGDLASALRISACRDEYEAAQLVIVPYGKALKQVRVAASDLKGPDGAVIPAGDVQLNRVGYVRTRKPAYEVDYVGWYADPLMDIAPFDVAKGILQPVWVTVHPSKDARAGLYRGTVTVAPANAPRQTVPIEVRVWDFTMPTTPRLKTAFAMCEGQLGAWYGGLTPEIQHAYYDFMLEHKINPTNIYGGPMPTKENMGYCVDRGLNCFNLGYISAEMDDAQRATLLASLKDSEAFLKEKGWWDKAYIYGFDEPSNERIPAIKREFGWVKENFPDLKRMCTTQPNEKLKGYIDIWCPILHAYNAEDAKKFEDAGDDVWWYVAWIPGHPYPNFLTDYPAIDQRVLPWMNWKYKVPGLLYYCVNLWSTNTNPYAAKKDWCWPQEWAVLSGLKAGKRWPEIPWNTFTCSNCNGDGQLIYPGPNGKPISSIRMEMIRDGIEDYECFHILSDLVAAAEKSGTADLKLLAKARKLLTISDDVVRSTSDYTKEPGVLLDARRNVAEAIEQLRAGN